MPAPVRIRNSCRSGRSLASNAAAHRVPLPDSSGSLPSELNSRIDASHPSPGLRSIRIHPSAPTPVYRSQIATAISGRPLPGASSMDVNKKSFFAPCSLAKGILVVPIGFWLLNSFFPIVDLQYRLAFHVNSPAQFIMQPVQAGHFDNTLRLIPPRHHRPVRP